jgi:hypothetical protein
MLSELLARAALLVDKMKDFQQLSCLESRHVRQGKVTENPED